MKIRRLPWRHCDDHVLSSCALSQSNSEVKAIGRRATCNLLPPPARDTTHRADGDGLPSSTEHERSAKALQPRSLLRARAWPLRETGASQFTLLLVLVDSESELSPGPQSRSSDIHLLGSVGVCLLSMLGSSLCCDFRRPSISIRCTALPLPYGSKLSTGQPFADIPIPSASSALQHDVRYCRGTNTRTYRCCCAAQEEEKTDRRRWCSR